MRLLKHLFATLLLLLIVVGGIGYWISQPLAGLMLASRLSGIERFSSDVLRTHVEFLCANTSARTHARPATLNRAATYIEENLRSSGARVRSDWFELEGVRYRNVIAGFGPDSLPEMVLGAHYDVAEETKCGADDNASGVAGLLALAASLGRKAPEKSVELVFYTLEEPPYFATPQMGSRRHAAQLASAGAHPKLVLVLEMIGYFDQAPGSQRYPLPGMGWLYPDAGNFIALVGDFTSTAITATIKQVMVNGTGLSVYSINAPTWVPGVALSDHAAYWDYDIPALMLTDTAFFRNPHYHRPDDLPETLDYQRMAQVLEALALVLRHFDGKE